MVLSTSVSIHQRIRNISFMPSFSQDRDWAIWIMKQNQQAARSPPPWENQMFLLSERIPSPAKRVISAVHIFPTNNL